MVSQLLVDQNMSLRKMMEGMKAISAQTSCKKDSIPKGEQRGYQSLHARLLHKHAMPSTLQHPRPVGNVPVRLSQTNKPCQGKLAVSLAINYSDDSTNSDRTLKKQYLDGTKCSTQPAVNHTTSGLRTDFRSSNVQAKVTPQIPNPLSASSGLTYRGSPITPTPYTFRGFPSDKGNSFESSSDIFSAPTKSASQTVSKAVNPKVVCITFMPSTLVTDRLVLLLT